ncbi:HAMP domain-containing sensor histidine kinase [Massilia sp. LC238]|uniref:sensor histidine kinase n=1 Tax=Massilia sp. LC238 TaxID=1502852 RepID=UPI0004E36E72|nr:HAMP domain-containing sensor histidine kinase [Massilia sp. LC238]KFC74645.1 PAS domain S-box protein [Massilia sp. LC238]
MPSRAHSTSDSRASPAVPVPALPRLVACACALIAAICLLGWAAGIDSLVSVFAGLPAMVPLTATLTLLASGALTLHGRGADTRFGPALALLVTAMAAAILLAHGSARLDWPFASSFIADHAGWWRLSSPLTAAMFFSMGISLLALPRARHVQLAQWLALGVLSLAALTLASYMFRDTFLYQSLPGSGTSILTALVLILLPLGALAARPSEGMMAAVAGHTPEAQMARRLLLSAIAMPVLLGALVWLALHFDATDTETGIALLVWGIVALIVASTWHAALRLNRADAARRRAEQALERALDSLREADAHKDRFMAVLAHELRNPLAPIRAAADLLRLPGGADAAQQHRTAEIIARQVETMTHLVEDLLDVSRVRQGLIAAERAPVDLCLVLNDALDQTRPLFRQRRHRLHADLPPQGPVVLGDHKRLVQIVANLLVNAAKYTPEGGAIRLALQVGRERAEISVHDNGVGIEAGMLGRVFDSFSQVTRTPGRNEGGLGIGLALVNSLVELHGGTVSAHSAGLGLGSTFVVTLPCAPAAAQPDAVAS